MDRMNRRRRPLPVHIVLVALLLPAACVSSEPAVGHTCPMNVSEPVAAAEARLVDGTLHVGDPPGRVYDTAQFRSAPNGSGYELCTCVLKRCVVKCCRQGHVWNGTCTKHDDYGSLGPVMVPKLLTENGTIASFKTDDFVLVHEKLKCNADAASYELNPNINGNADSFVVSEYGALQNEVGSTMSPPGQFCLERFSEGESKLVAIVCGEPETVAGPEDANDQGLNLFYLTAMVLSTPFLLLTFLVYALNGKLRNLHGKCLICHVASLLVAYVSLITVQIATNSVNNGVCIALAYITQFSFIASFFWLSTMSFDLWTDFSGFGLAKRSSKENEFKKFIIYSIFAWGCTFSISIVTYFMEFTFKDSSLIQPGFGKTNCWFSTNPAIMLYFYGPILILLLCNLMMFIHTSILIADRSTHGKLFKKSNHNKNMDREKQRFSLYFQLFIVMGLNWLAEILSWAFEDYKSLEYVWYITDMGNALQGVFIFIIFVCKKRVLKITAEKFCPRSFKNVTSAGANTTASIDSNGSSSSDSEDVLKNPVELISDNEQNSLNR